MVILQHSEGQTSNFDLNATFFALADPTRRAILARLVDGEATVNDLVAPFNISQPAISKHLKVLERAGLISTSLDKQKRPRRIEAAPMEEAVDWLEKYRELWEGNYIRLDALLGVMKGESKTKNKKLGGTK